MPMILVPANGGRPIPLDKAIVFLGRGQECDVVLTNSRKVSRKHCCVVQIDDRFVVRDLGSMNGVRINGELIEREGEFVVGDELCIGDQAFRLQPVSHAGARQLKSPAGGNRFVPQQSIPGSGPIALPDEPSDFQVEETGAQPKFTPQLLPSDAELLLREDDVVDSPEEDDEEEVFRLRDDDLD